MRTPRPAPRCLLRHPPLFAALACALATPGMAATWIVNDSSNNVAGGTCFAAPAASTCSLHQAMQEAVNACDPDAQIQFNLPSPFVISPSALRVVLIGTSAARCADGAMRRGAIGIDGRTPSSRAALASGIGAAVVSASPPSEIGLSNAGTSTSVKTLPWRALAEAATRTW